MARKELISLLEQNVFLFGKLSERINRNCVDFGEYSRQQVQFLIRLHINGRARLKDFAAREFIPAPNLCTVFRKLEHDGLVARDVDDNDRRNTWYSVTKMGAEMATKFMDVFHNAVANIFKDIDKTDEEILVKSFKSIHDVFVKMELKNA